MNLLIPTPSDGWWVVADSTERPGRGRRGIRRNYRRSLYKRLMSGGAPKPPKPIGVNSSKIKRLGEK